MAEAFSIAAGIVGLASLGIQLGESVAKLAGACSTYKNASDDISALIASLQTFQQILEHVCPASQPIQGTHVPAQLLQECKEWCQDIKDGVNGVMTSIQDEIQQTPKWGKTRLIFRKSSVEQWLQKLQRSKLDLLLAHQIFGRYQDTAQIRVLQEELQKNLQTGQLVQGWLPTIDDRIKQLKVSVEDLLRRSRQVEQTVQALQSTTVPSLTAAEEIQTRLRDLNDAQGKTISLQNSLLQKYEGEAIQHGLKRFQQYLDSGENDRKAVLSELQRLNDHLGQTSVLGGDFSRNHLERDKQTTDFHCMFFSYRSERISTRSISRRDDMAVQHHERDTIWLSVHIPSWFLKNQWALSVAKATRGWHYSLRMYRVLSNDADIFNYCMNGDLEKVKKMVLGGEVSIYDQNESGLTLLHAAAFAHQGDLCDFLTVEGARPHALSNIKESPLHALLYLIPRSPSVGRSLRLFEKLHTLYQDGGLTPNHSENARLFLTSSHWTPLDQLLFTFKLHQPPSTVVLTPILEQEIDRVMSLRTDLAQIKLPLAKVLLSTVRGPGNTSSVLHLASMRFLEVALFELAPEPGLYVDWRQLCIDVLRSGCPPCLRFEGDSDWSTPLGASVRRILDTLHARKVDWDRTRVIVENCLGHWNQLLADSGIAGLHSCLSREIELYQYAKPAADAKELLESSAKLFPRDLQWKLFKARTDLHFKTSSLGFDLWHHELDAAWSDEAYDCLRIRNDHALEAKTKLALRLNSSRYLGVQAKQNDTPDLPGRFPRYEHVNETPLYDEEPNAEVSSPRLSDIDTPPETIAPMNVHPLDFQSKKFEMGDIMAGATSDAWSAMHQILANSPIADAYRKLRFGVDHFVEPSRYDFGHGVECNCRQCIEERVVAQADRQAAYDVLYTRTSGGKGGGGGWRDPMPRDPGNG